MRKNGISMDKVGKSIGGSVEALGTLTTSAAHSIASRPSSESTLTKVYGAILLNVSSIGLPSGGVRMDWLEVVDPSLTSHSGADDDNNLDLRGQSYILLAQRLYSLLSTTHELSPLVRHLLLSLFVNIGEGTLLFLAGLWASIESSSSSVVKDHPTSTAALHHARAFLTAHTGLEKKRDFQVIVPSVLIALMSEERGVREAATMFLKTLVEIGKEIGSGSGEGEVEIYAFDAAYRRACESYLLFTLVLGLVLT